MASISEAVKAAFEKLLCAFLQEQMVTLALSSALEIYKEAGTMFTKETCCSPHQISSLSGCSQTSGRG